MGLLAFENPSSCPDSELTQYSARHKLASKVNTAILQSHCKSHRKQIPSSILTIICFREETAYIFKNVDVVPGAYKRCCQNSTD